MQLQSTTFFEANGKCYELCVFTEGEARQKEQARARKAQREILSEVVSVSLQIRLAGLIIFLLFNGSNAGQEFWLGEEGGERDGDKWICGMEEKN